MIVARDHEPFWRHALRAAPGIPRFVQPRNCGTANGILLSTLRIAARDRDARIVFLPADHYVRNEAALAQALRSAVTLLATGAHDLLLVGVKPEAVDPELGYIVPGARHVDGTSAVAGFVEKPCAAIAQELIARGALWNSFIFAARATALLERMRRAHPQIVAGMEAALVRRKPRGRRSTALDELYESLPVIDFSRQILQRAESGLGVLAAPECGWTDLGTPIRVSRALADLRSQEETPDSTVPPAILDLSARQIRCSPRG